MSQRILVVCIGNICRSPTAEVLFRHYVPGLSVSSAGLHALSGQPMDPMAQAVLEAHGLDGRRHLARQLHGSLIHDADLILAMEKSQVDTLRSLAPEAFERIFLLGRWQHETGVPDPFRRRRPAFEQAYGLIDTAVKAWLPHVRAH